MRRREEKTTTAYHEAGHAVVAFLQGLRVKTATISRPASPLV